MELLTKHLYIIYSKKDKNTYGGTKTGLFLTIDPKDSACRVSSCFM